MTDKETPIEVTLVDRVTAGPHARCLKDMQDIFEGKADGLSVVQAFARHRLTATEAQSAEIARLRAENERLREALNEASGIINTVALTDEYGDIDGDQSAIINAQQRIKAALSGESA